MSTADGNMLLFQRMISESVSLSVQYNELSDWIGSQSHMTAMNGLTRVPESHDYYERID